MATRLVFQFQPLLKKSTSHFQPLFNKIISATISDFSGRITPPPPVDAQERFHPMDPQQIFHPTAGNQFMAKGIGYTGMHLPPEQVQDADDDYDDDYDDDEEEDGTEDYIVSLGVRKYDEKDQHLETAYHHEVLGSVLGSKEDAKYAIFHSFQCEAVSAFAATLTRAQALKLTEYDDTVTVITESGGELEQKK